MTAERSPDYVTAGRVPEKGLVLAAGTENWSSHPVSAPVVGS